MLLIIWKHYAVNVPKKILILGLIRAFDLAHESGEKEICFVII